MVALVVLAVIGFILALVALYVITGLTTAWSS